ncbi:MAG: hypothetical protein ACYS22_13110, partial [Planctomycetota bacterium]
MRFAPLLLLLALLSLLPGVLAPGAHGAPPTQADALFARAKGFADKSQFDRAQEILTRLIEAVSAHRKGRELRGYC